MRRRAAARSLPPLLKDLALRAAVPLDRILGSRAAGGIGILMYHRVSDGCAGAPEPTFNVTPRRFREQLGELLARGFEAWPLDRILEHQRAARPVPPRVFAVTFDDGYECVDRDAWPVLRSLRVPATVFLATAFLDRDDPFPFDDWSARGSPRVAAQAWRPLRSEQCREMAADGLVELGAHTHTHADFRGRPPEFERDLARSVGVLADRFGVSAPSFAFPYGVRRLGYASPELVEAAKRTGVTCSLSTEAELVDPAGDPFTWGRFEIGGRDSGATIAARLDGWLDLLRAVRHRLGGTLRGARVAEGLAP
jgi:peptidoglycan/xylan/chitin deacetylase (PgdA/CDA1 family)